MRLDLAFTTVVAMAVATSASTSGSSDMKVINRQLEASITADDWKTFPSSPFCEAFAYIQAAPVSSSSDNDGDNDSEYNTQNSHQKLHQLWNRNYLSAIHNVLEEVRGGDALVTYTYMDGIDYAIQAAQISLKKTMMELQGAGKNPDETVDGDDGNLEKKMEFHIRMLGYSLATRAHAPLCEMHRALAHAAEEERSIKDESSTESAPKPFVVWEDLDAGYWAKLLPDEEGFLHGGGGGDGDEDNGNHRKVAILYGDFSDPAFGRHYEEMLSKQIPFVVRYMGSGNDTSSTTLQGYGVRVDIRNVEYKSFDDKAGGDDDESSDDSISQNTENREITDKLKTFTAEQWKNAFTNGIDPNIVVIHEQMKRTKSNENANTGLEEFFAKYLPYLKMNDFNHAQPNMLSRKSDDDSESNEKVQKLSLQATKVISKSHDPLWTMQQLSQNLPSYADALSSISISEDFTNDILKMYSMYEMLDTSGDTSGMRGGMPFMQGGLGGKDGIFKFHVNGRRMVVERPSFNLFSLIHTIREENSLLEELKDTLPVTLGDNDDDSNMMLMNELAELLTMGKEGFDNLAIEETDDDDDDDDYSYDDDDEEEDAKAMMKMMGLDLDEPKVRIDVGTGYKGAVMYLNDIEKDETYRNWPRSMQQAMMSMQFGGGFTVRRNLLTALVVVDPTSSKVSENVADSLGILLQLLQNGTPLRVGIIFATDHDIDSYQDHIGNDYNSEWTPTTSGACDFQGNDKKLLECKVTTEMVMKLVQHVVGVYGKAIGFPYSYLVMNDLAEIDNATVQELVNIHAEAMIKMRVPANDAETIVFAAIKKPQASTAKSETYSKSIHFAVKKNIRPGMAFVNGIPFNISDPEQTQRSIMEEVQRLLGMAMSGKITDDNPRSIYAMLLKGAHKTMHPLLAEENPNYRVLSEDMYQSASSIIELTSSRHSNDPKVLFEIVTNLTSLSSLKNLLYFLKSIEVIQTKMKSEDNTEQTAVALCIIPSNESSIETGGLESILKQEISSLNDIIRAVEEKVNSMETTNEISDNVKSGTTIMANGRVFQPLSSGITVEDIELLIETERKSAKMIEKRLNPHLSKDANVFSVVAKSVAYLGHKFSSPKFISTERSEPRAMYKEMAEIAHGSKASNPLYFSWNKSENQGPKVKVTTILDPLSDSTQRAAPLLRIIRDSLNLPLEIILLPRTTLGEESTLPLTTYYRFVNDPLDDLKTKANISASFEGLPSNQILTIRMDVPEPWDVQQSSVVQDTDNLRCNANSCGDIAYAKALQKDNDKDTIANDSTSHLTTVKYSLNNLLFSGQCYDVSDQSPPNGLQITLSDASLSDTYNGDALFKVLPNGDVSQSPSSHTNSSIIPKTGTLVMKTVGYWQLRSGPGVWRLDIANGTRGAEIYQMVEGEVAQGRIDIKSRMVPTNSRILVMKDFVQPMEIILVQKKEGYEDAELLVEEANSSGSDDDTIHVFSLATGHFYERLLKIMMLSVTKRSSSKVKFWLFENFLSPSFKTSAYAMAAKIGCEVEFVTYKWPEWLRAQSEKQRIIWGYKILFLDVLFPLDLKKVIYVDADQVVRGDLKELWDLDLEGAPYGYTPMCESREETKGYRFWQHGFWPNHLRGKPYHISALYVVDLQRFRRELVGDRLRATYQQLSSDPNNLSNLDQDLPNYTQHQIPIKSLPQDWLWCESWCSEESKSTAKTIDLCNNPEHKEPKVSMAKRIISGELFEESWVELDAEVEAYEQE